MFEWSKLAFRNHNLWQIRTDFLEFNNFKTGFKTSISAEKIEEKSSLLLRMWLDLASVTRQCYSNKKWRIELKINGFKIEKFILTLPTLSYSLCFVLVFERNNSLQFSQPRNCARFFLLFWLFLWAILGT